MEGEASSSDRQQQKRRRQKRSSESLSFERSVENLSKEGKDTLRIVNQNLRRSSLNTIQYTSSVVFDNTSPAYDWLPSGWIAEERVKSQGRLYRYYYDPMGKMYKSRKEVDRVCADIEKNRLLVILD